MLTMPSEHPLKHVSPPLTPAVQDPCPLTFDIPQGEVSIPGGFWGQGEVEAVSRLGLISIHHADGVN